MLCGATRVILVDIVTRTMKPLPWPVSSAPWVVHWLHMESCHINREPTELSSCGEWENDNLLATSRSQNRPIELSRGANRMLSTR